MTKKIDRNDLDTVAELPLDALDNVLGGAGTSPMGMGGSLAAAATATAPTSHGVGYHDHFGLHLGASGGDHNGLGFHEAGHDPHAASQQATGVATTHGPSPVGMGGSIGGTGMPGASATTGDASAQHAPAGGIPASAAAAEHGSAGQFEVNATSAFSLVDQAAPQDDAAAAAAEHGPAPVGLGGDY